MQTHKEGPLLREMIQPKPKATAGDIARTGGFSRQYVSQVLTGKLPASERFIDACRELGLSVDHIWPQDMAKPAGPIVRSTGGTRR